LRSCYSSSLIFVVTSDLIEINIIIDQCSQPNTETSKTESTSITETLTTSLLKFRPRPWSIKASLTSSPSIIRESRRFQTTTWSKSKRKRHPSNLGSATPYQTRIQVKCLHQLRSVVERGLLNYWTRFPKRRRKVRIATIESRNSLKSTMVTLSWLKT